MILTGQALVAKARKLAVEYHDGQFRADKKTPYIQHPLDVEQRFINFVRAGCPGLSSDAVAMGQALALIHDVAEDAEVLFELLAREGLESIIPALRVLTKFDGGSYLNYILRVKEFVERPGNSPLGELALAVKLADMESNLADLSNIPSAGARKGLKTKYELARYILLS